MFGIVLLEINWNPFLQILNTMKKSCTNIIFKEWFYIYHINCGVIQGFLVPRKAVTTREKMSYFFFLFFLFFFYVCWYSQSTTDTSLAFGATRSGWWMNGKVFTILNTSSQGARPSKNWFRSTHPTGKAWQLTLIDQYLFFKIRYYVVPNCGTANEINGALYHDMAFSMEMRFKQNLASNFIFFHWSAPQTLLEKWWSCICLQFECSHGTTACHVIVAWPFFRQKAVSFVDPDLFQILLRLG